MRTILRSTHLLLILTSFLLVRCGKKDEPITPKSSAKSLTNPAIDGVLSATSTYDAPTSTYTMTVPFGTVITALKLSFNLSTGATSNPPSGSSQNFTNPITYTVTAEDGSTQNYIVKVVVMAPPKSSEKQITEFRFPALTPIVSATIDQTTRKITAVVPLGTNVSALAPSIALSAKATVLPASGVVQNFTNPVIYTVTAEDGSTQTYEITITASASPTATIVDDNNYTVRAEIKDNRLILTASSKTGGSFSPGIHLDSNLNGKLDRNVDRGYGETPGGAFCPYYLVDPYNVSFCGTVTSSGSLAKSGNSFVFSIPVSELLPPDKDTISLLITIYSNATGTIQFYPLFNPDDYFGKSFKIKVR